MIGLALLSAIFLKPWFAFVGLVKPAVFPQPLNELEEADCLRRMHEGDEMARNKLIEHNLRLVAHVVKKFESNRSDAEDFISIGTIGLMKAISRFQPQMGTKLATFAARCIENEILMHLRSSKKQRKNVSLHEPFGTDTEGNDITLLDVLGTDGEEIIDEIHLKMEQKHIRAHLPILTDREKFVIGHRYGLGDDGVERTQKDIARTMGISRSYVSRIEKRALLKLYQAISKKEWHRYN